MFYQFPRSALAYWRKSTVAQQALFVAGTLLFISMFVHGLALIVTGGSIDGPVSFRKVITFSETLGLTCWAVAWMLPIFSLRRVATWLLTGFVLVFTLGEAALMSMQVWRGVPSHYNFTTPFDTAVYYATGIGAASFTTIALVLLVLTLRRPRATPSVLLAVRAGLVITLFGSIIGMLMSVNSGPVWQGFAAIVQRYQQPPFGQYIGQPEGTAGGNLVLLHALGVHGLQLLPLVAWMLGYSALAERARTGLVAATAISFGVLLTALSIQTFRSLPPFALDPLTGALLAVSALAVTLCYAATAWYTLRGISAAQPTTAAARSV
ncbi:MAG: hypothetical protein H7Z42_20370 [Roseiflexaceae bacterium]|nr:hypothetical protein [Roseiflexaceae bacterium]